MKRYYVLFLKKIELLTLVSMRLTQLTGKSKVVIHPKHFLNEKAWFVPFLKKTDKVLDLGSGNGSNAIKASLKVKSVLALEYDQKYIDKATKLIDEKGIVNFKLKKADLEKKLDLKDGSFDVVLLLDVLEHLHKRDQILFEIKRILKKKGRLFVGVPNNETSWKRLQRSVGLSSYSDVDHKIEYSEDEIRRILEEKGFIVEKFMYDTFDTPFKGFYDLVGGLSISAYKKLYERRKEISRRKPNEASGFKIIASK